MSYKDGYDDGYSEPPPLTTFHAPVFYDPMKKEAGAKEGYSLWRWYDDIVPVVQPVIIASGTVIPTAAEGRRIFTVDELAAADAGSGEEGKAIFRGKMQHDVTSEEGTLLDAAGYTVT